MLDKVIEKINVAQSIAVLGHINEDPDSIGSCFAFAMMMRKLGKKATVYMSAEPEKRLGFMGDDYVVYTGGELPSYDLCAVIDCGDINRLGERIKIFEDAKNTVSIDHHHTNTYFAQANYVDGEAAAAAELLCRLFRKMELPLDKEIAKQLYTALSSDTGGFKFSNVSPQTMREAADLLEYGFEHAEIARLLFDSDTFEEIRFKAYVMQGIKTYADGKICIVSVDDKMIEESGITASQIPNVVDIPRRVTGCEVAVALRKKDNEIRVNLRSNGNADVSAIALKFGGGGHVKAAGCNVKTTDMDEAEKAVIEACIEVL